MVKIQETSLDIWDKKYRLKDLQGNPVDEDIQATYNRVAWALAEVEEDPSEWYTQFLWALENGAIPAGRIMSNAGAGEYKPATSTINCTVSGQIQDSMDDILNKVHESGMTLKAGCGIGYEFSTLRPKGAYVAGAGATTSGPLSFMDIYDSMCFTISSAGGRRGAQMGTLDVRHPDVFEFIKAKREDGRLRQFNLSLLITDDFMQAVKDDSDWNLIFPCGSGDTSFDVVETWPGYDEPVPCKIYKIVKARALWDTIMRSTYDFAEPGFILIDKVNKMNNNWFCEDIRATNPCGEQPLPPYGACLLGSINLTKFVKDPFTHKASFDWEKYRKVVRLFTRMLDNVVEINNLPLEQQRQEIEYKRRHGMGYLGLGSALTMMQVKYGSDESVKFTEEVTKELALEGWREGVNLSMEKGCAPLLEDPENRLSFVHSPYMEQVFKEDEELREWVLEYGCRFTHHTSIAPTGTISLSLANNASNGIEPSFAHHYSRNVIREGKKSKENVDVFSYELLAYRTLVNPEAMPYTTDPDNMLPDYFVSSEDISPIDHVKIQAAAQKWIDSSISKTINIPTDYPFDAFKDVYMQAYDYGLKGCTTFRFNPEAFQGVLVKEQDLENTFYSFTTEEGEVITAKGNEKIEYDGEVHTAANLYDALKEGYYGRF